MRDFFRYLRKELAAVGSYKIKEYNISKRWGRRCQWFCL